MFERKHEKLLSRREFFRRLAKYALVSLGLVIVSLLIGMLDYSQYKGMSWIDAFLNAAMGGMGPVNTLYTDAGKLFAGIYALYCGMVLLIAVGIFAVPIVHRFLHHFHLESERK
jgi:putative effector of murein hydrolase